MKIRLIVLSLVTAAALALGLAAPAAGQSGAAAEQAAARKPLEQYIKGHQTGSADVMRQAFHPTARLQWMDNGKYTERPLEQWLSGFRGTPAQDEAQRKRRIVSVELFGDSGVGVIELDYPNMLIIDYMSLLKVDGEWKIVNKIFARKPKAAK